MASDDPAVWKQLLDWASIAVGALLALVWKRNEAELARLDAKLEARAKELAERIDAKASLAELDRQRDNIGALFDEHKAIRQEMHAGHTRLLEAISHVGVQVAALSGKIHKEDA